MTDIERILALPVEETPEISAKIRGCVKPGGSMQLRPVQEAALEYIHRHRGALLALGIGCGKTLIGQLVPFVTGIPAERVLVLTKAPLIKEAKRQFAEYTDHFNVEMPIYLSYSKLSQPDAHDVLQRIDPEIIVADEAHCLKSSTATRTKRFFRFLRKRKGQGRPVHFVAMSGTLTGRSLTDYAHLASAALGHASPLPHKYTVLESWCRCLDSKTRVPSTSWDWRDMDKLVKWSSVDPDTTKGRQHTARCAFAERMQTCQGVVCSTNSSCDKELIFKGEITCEIPPQVKAAMKEAKSVMEIDGFEIEDPLRLSATLRELSQGFYYRWDWGGREPDRQWLHRRSRLSCAVREYIKRNPKFDSWSRVVNALAKGKIDKKYVSLHRAYEKWLEVAGRSAPDTRAVWLSSFLLDQVAYKPGTVYWYGHRAVGKELAKRIPTAMGGEDVPDSDCVALSIASHGVGLNLQRYNNNVILCPPGRGGIWEQLLGRTHRSLQTRDVSFSLYTHTPELKKAWKQANKDSEYIQETIKTVQRLNLK